MLERSSEEQGRVLQTKPEALKFDYVVKLLPLFQVYPDVERVILFGSRARGDHQERSDIDLAVDAPDMDVLTWDKLCSSIADNSVTLLSIDLTWLQHTVAGLRARIQREGVIVFERENDPIN